MHSQKHAIHRLDPLHINEIWQKFRKLVLSKQNNHPKIGSNKSRSLFFGVYWTFVTVISATNTHTQYALTYTSLLNQIYMNRLDALFQHEHICGTLDTILNSFHSQCMCVRVNAYVSMCVSNWLCKHSATHISCILKYNLDYVHRLSVLSHFG